MPAAAGATRRASAVLLFSLVVVLSAAVSAQAATLYVSPSGSDSAACTSAAPCGSFERAYSVAAAGDVVEIRAGSYGGQDIDAAPKASGPAVVFRPRPALP